MTSGTQDMSKLLQKFKGASGGQKEKIIENEDDRRPTATSSQTKKTDDNWDDDDETQDTQKTGTRTIGGRPKKTTNKSNQPTTWGPSQTDALADEFKEKEPTQKGIMSKPGTKKAPQADILAEEFPDLGAAVDPTKTKKKPKVQEPTPTDTTTTTTQSGPKRFVNTKKAAGETFAQLEAVPEKKVEEPVVKTETQAQKPTETITKADAPKEDKPEKQSSGGFGLQRGPARSELASKAETTKPEEPAADSKFKFGGDGPKRFVSSKKEGQHKEETKTEADLKREEAERRAEEALQAEKQKIAAENASKKEKKLLGHKNERPQDKQGGEGEKKHHENGKQRNGDHGDGEGKHKKDDKHKGEKTKKETHTETKEEAPKEEGPKVTVSHIIKADHNTELSQTGWDMPIKKSKKP
eukprot:CAMPEP_0176475052 /NCGR_PEP_ID=MMETSP0127-20121128/43387_1 /TAXON_ID=938130 /ORGANISM="Platyophrya macrostoma, Strain WH" /LENGTH=409 /DNA_ID=CAMNT_0017870595 /DNA_START=73 /DNA_END=1302 /DNA_ORIENTATION=+